MINKTKDSHLSADTLLKGVRKWENAHIALWLLKDTCWLLSYREAALVMAVPTVTLAAYLTWRLRSHLSEFAHNLAVCCWIGGNVIWMVGEFYHDDTWRPFAKWFFFSGLLILAAFYTSRPFRLTRRG